MAKKPFGGKKAAPVRGGSDRKQEVGRPQAVIHEDCEGCEEEVATESTY